MSSFFDTIADIYDETRGLPKQTMKEVIEVMTDVLKDCRKVLEIGIGTGRFAEPLQRKGVEVVGIDISRPMLNKAQLKGLDRLIMGDACSLPFKDSSFDSIISVHVLHLIENCNKALSEIKRVGKGELLSVLYTKSDFEVIEEYREALSRSGFSLKLPGITERDIKKRIPPKREVKIEAFEEMFTIREKLRLLEERKHSYTLETTPGIHKRAIRYLENKHADKMDEPFKSEIEVVFWNIADLQNEFSI
ncbi:MAG: class I SAM-dependent methyltransferase [Thermoplasmata archaeon]